MEQKTGKGNLLVGDTPNYSKLTQDKWQHFKLILYLLNIKSVCIIYILLL